MEASIKHSIHEIFSILTFILWFIIASYHSITFFKFRDTDKTVKLSVYLSFLLVFLAFTDLLTLIIETFDPIQTKIFCLIIQHGGTVSYALFKCTTYLILLMRLYELFQVPTVNYNAKKLKRLGYFLISWTLINIILGLVLMDSNVDILSVPVCVISFPFFLPASWALADLFAIGTCSYLYIRTLFKLRKQIKSLQSTEDNVLFLKYLAVKQCILSSIACGTTIISMMLMGTLQIAPVAIGIDLNVTIICIILMYSWNKYIIYWCCPRCKENIKQHLEITTSKVIDGQQPVASKVSKTNLESHDASNNDSVPSNPQKQGTESEITVDISTTNK
eukprot:492063_1